MVLKPFLIKETGTVFATEERRVENLRIETLSVTLPLSSLR